MSSSALGSTAVCDKLITSTLDAPNGTLGSIDVDANLSINGTLLNVAGGTITGDSLSVSSGFVDFNNLPTVAPADSGRVWNNAGVLNVVP